MAMRSCPFVLAAFAAASGCASAVSKAEGPQAPPGEAWLTPDQIKESEIHVVPVSEKTVHATVTAGGKVSFDDLRVTHVFSPVTGRITRVLAQAGARVKKGASLVAIASPDVGSTFSDLVKAEAS
jgi:cobalt-zinc-cadmium efflux system membrane fusion protein